MCSDMSKTLNKYVLDFFNHMWTVAPKQKGSFKDPLAPILSALLKIGCVNEKKMMHTDADF